jgi:hypothetical protein
MNLPESLLGLTHSLRENKTLRLLPCVAMTEIRRACVSPIYKKSREEPITVSPSQSHS